MASSAPQPAGTAPDGTTGGLPGGGRTTAMLCEWQALSGEAMRLAWDALAARASQPNPFFESWFLLPSLETLDPDGAVQLFCLEQDGALLGLMPLRREAHYYGYPFPHWRNWVHSNAFLGAPLVAQGYEEAFWQALLHWADENAGASVFFHVTEMPMDGALFAALRRVTQAHGKQAAVVHRYERAMLQSALTPDAYFDAALSGKRRSELRRRQKRLGEHGTLTFNWHRGGENIDSWLAEFLALEAAGWKGQAASALNAAPTTERLFRSVMANAALLGRLDRLEMRLDGKAVALITSIAAAPGAFGFKTAYDEAFARFSPGVILQRQFLALLERKGTDWCDSCSAPGQPMISQFWSERRAIARVSIAVGGKLRQAAFRQILRAEGGEALENTA